MEIIIVTFAALLILIGLVIYLITQIKKPKEDAGALQLHQQQLIELQKGIDGKLGESNKMFQEQFKASNDGLTKNLGTTLGVAKDSTKKIEELTENLIQTGETNKQNKGIGHQLKDVP